MEVWLRLARNRSSSYNSSGTFFTASVGISPSLVSVQHKSRPPADLPGVPRRAPYGIETVFGCSPALAQAA